MSPDHEGERLTITRPNGDVIEGRYLGWGTNGETPVLEINNAPAGHPINKEFFSYSRRVPVERGLLVNGIPAEDFDAR